MLPFIYIGSMQIPTFFLVVSLSLTLLLFFLSYRVDLFSVNREIAFNIALILMAAGFTGGRLMHVFYEEWDYYKNNLEKILFFWNGGFVFLGGLILCLIVGLIYAKIKKISFFQWADFFTPLFSLSHAFGRLGCLLSGCCFGSSCTLPWAIGGLHPTALYLIIGELLIFTLLIFGEKKKVYTQKGILFTKWILLHSLLRFNIEFFRDDFRGVFIYGLSVSQIISLVLILASSAYIFKRFPAQADLPPHQ